MRVDFASAEYDRARRAFVYKQPSAAAAHPAAVGPVIQPRPLRPPMRAAGAT